MTSSSAFLCVGYFDADRFRTSLGERLRKFGLELHPDKTRRIEFGRYAEQNRKRGGEGKPETFDFLGFTHISGKTGNGSYAVRRMTVRKRMRKKLQEIKQQLRMRMHAPVPRPARGSSQSYRRTSTTMLCREISIASGRSGERVLRYRGQAGSSAVVKDTGTPGRVVSNWPHNGFLHLVVLHPYPLDRFAATHPR